jgi:hypothetical protein
MGMTSPVSKNYVIGLTVATSPHRPAPCASMVNRKPPLIRKHPLESDRGRQYRRVCADAAGSAADERRERQRRHHQQRQARYSQRLRRALPAQDLTSEDAMAQPPIHPERPS